MIPSALALPREPGLIRCTLRWMVAAFRAVVFVAERSTLATMRRLTRALDQRAMAALDVRLWERGAIAPRMGVVRWTLRGGANRWRVVSVTVIEALSHLCLEYDDGKAKR